MDDYNLLMFKRAMELYYGLLSCDKLIMAQCYVRLITDLNDLILDNMHDG